MCPKAREERINANDFAASVHQRSTRIAGIDGCVGLDELARLASVVIVGIRPVQRAHDTASHGKAESIRIAEGEYRLSRMQCRRIADRNVGQVAAVHLDDRKIGKRIGADHLRLQNTTVAQRDLYIGCAINDVIVGNDVSVRRDDDTAADAVFDLRLLLSTCPPNCSPKNCCMPSGTPSADRLAFTREVTATLTIAGVTRAATASIA